jgi:protein SCO1/2
MRRQSPVVSGGFVALLWTALLWPGGLVCAQRMEAPPEDLLEVGVTERLNQQLPLDLEFVDSSGRTVKLGEYFDGQRPVVLTLNYSNCPMLCSMQLDGLFDGLKKMKWELGQEYTMVTVSIDPNEPTERAAMTRDKYLRHYGRAGAGAGYACLVGENKNIRALADAVGFGYRYVPESGEYSHAAVTMICTPDGRLSRYLYGVEYDQQTLRMSLLEAAEGKIGSPMEQLMLFCFQYDSSSGRYGPAAVKLMKLGAGAMVLVVGGVLFMFWRRETAPPVDETMSGGSA